MELRVLIISRSAWNDTNSHGNTLSSIFQNFSTKEVAQIFCRDEIPQNSICKKYFKISERLIILNLLNRRNLAGEKFIIDQFSNNSENIKQQQNEKKYYDFFCKNRWIVFLWLRELLWIAGRWASDEMKVFIKEYNPTVIYTEASDSYYMYSLLKYVQKISGVPFVIFHADDQATFRQFSISPLFWIHRIILRMKMKDAINSAEMNYCIIDRLQEVYKRIFKKKFKLLYKCADFSMLPQTRKVNSEKPIQFVYAGNIFYSRWKTLAKVAKSINKLNSNGTKIVFKIYTANIPSKRIIKALNYPKSVMWMSKIPFFEIPSVLEESDVLLHVESFNFKERLITALSFSTKIVDYFKSSKCIIAIGWRKAASIKYLKQNDAAIIVTSLGQIESTIMTIYCNTLLIDEYAMKGYECGKKNHDQSKVLKSFKEDLINLSSKN